ncbi:MAG: L,D-transpeptidase family protein [Nannocystaceae bacterium]
MRARLLERERHACHDAVDDAALADGTALLRTDRRADRHDDARRRAVLAVERHLGCEGLLDAAAIDGSFDARTRAVAAYQRRHAILGVGWVDEHTRAALREDSRELDIRGALRMLRERVVDATGLIEDGSASQAWQPVSGRMLDPPQLLGALGRAPLPGGAPDRVAAATQAAAEALGWSDLESIAASLDRRPDDCRVVLPLPALPAWRTAPLELRAEIDRGDVWYQYPWTPSGQPRAQPVEQQPTLTLFAIHDGVEEALVRWPTTIGGWERDRRPSGRVVLRYKASSPGTFVWRDVVAAPTWFPPPSTPNRELVWRRPDGRWVLREDTVGPGYRSAYGLAMLIHLQSLPVRGKPEPRWRDTGVRTHGSSSYLSVYGDHSHGCHRLPNHLALRLTSFVLRQREHEVLGPIVEHYARRVTWGSVRWIRRHSRGFGYRLHEPIEVIVREGTVRGPVREPSTRSWPLPPRRRRATAAARRRATR